MRHEESYRCVPLFQLVLDRSATWIATGGFSGYAGVVPGTIGSFVGLLLYLPLESFPPLISLAGSVLLFFVGVFVSSRVETIWRIKDPQPVVIDEIVGMWIALLFIPLEIVYFLAAFVFFRLFDIIKPFPARQAELLPGGWGIMVDDVVAGIYANAAIQSLVTLHQFLS